MNTNTNESSIAALVNAANQKKQTENKGRDALAATQAQNNKSASPVTEKQKVTVGKRRNVYFSPKSLECIDSVSEIDGVGMSSAIQAALYMFANASDKKREAIYAELKIQCNFDK